MKKNILVIFGGDSNEYYVSCKSAADVLENIDNMLFNVFALGITLDGQWILTGASVDEIRDGHLWIKNVNNRRAIISPERNSGIIIFDKEKIVSIYLDCVFPLIHGYSGEDGKLQGLLELAGVDYVGSGVCASANSMDKSVTGVFADLCNIKRPTCKIVSENDFKGNGTTKIEQFNLKYPVFVKPANAGSSIGVSKVDDDMKIESAMKEAFLYDDKILIEQGITGKEIKVAILEDSKEQKLIIGELCEITVPNGEMNDYDTKYVNHSSVKKIPANIDNKKAEIIKNQAIKIFRELGCSGFARVDFFLDEEGEVYFNEINTIPGIGKNSIYSLMFDKVGISFTELLTKLINSSLTNEKGC